VKQQISIIAKCQPPTHKTKTHSTKTPKPKPKKKQQQERHHKEFVAISIFGGLICFYRMVDMIHKLNS